MKIKMKFIFFFCLSCDYSLEKKEPDDALEEDLVEKEPEAFLKDEVIKTKKKIVEIIPDQKKSDPEVEELIENIHIPQEESKFYVQEINLETPKIFFDLKSDQYEYFLEKKEDILEIYLKDCYEKNLPLKDLPFLLKSSYLGYFSPLESYLASFQDLHFFFKQEIVKSQLRKYENYKVTLLQDYQRGELHELKHKEPGWFFLTQNLTLNKEKSYILVVSDKKRLFEVNPYQILENVLLNLEPQAYFHEEYLLKFFDKENNHSYKWILFHSLKTLLKPNEIYPIFYYSPKIDEKISLEKQEIEILDQEKKINHEEEELILILKPRVYKPIFKEFEKKYTGYQFSLKKKEQDINYIGSFTTLNIKQRVYQGEEVVELDPSLIIEGFEIIKFIKKNNNYYYHLKKNKKNSFLAFKPIFFGNIALGPFDPLMKSCQNLPYIDHPTHFTSRMRQEGRLLTRVYNNGDYCRLGEKVCIDSKNPYKECAITAFNEYPTIAENKSFYYRQFLILEILKKNK